MGRKCNVLHCPSDSRRIEDQGITFHKIPHHTDLRPKWLQLCKIPEERKNVKVIYVCSKHFKKSDFCNFKGTKYMLKQGVLPSSFPWSSPSPKSSDQEPIIDTKKVSEDQVDVKQEDSPDIKTENTVDTVEVKNEKTDKVEEDTKVADTENPMVGGNLTTIPLNEESFKIKEEMFVSKEVKTEDISNLLPQSASTGSIEFKAGTRIEANDFHDKWYPAEIIEVDNVENEVFIRFEKCPNRGDEWIPMDSSRLRPLQPNRPETFEVNEKCLATWVDGKKFPATIKRVLDKGEFINDKYDC